MTFWTTTVRASAAITNHAVVAMIDDEVKQTRCATATRSMCQGGKLSARAAKAGAASADVPDGAVRPRAAAAGADARVD